MANCAVFVLSKQSTQLTLTTPVCLMQPFVSLSASSLEPSEERGWTDGAGEKKLGNGVAPNESLTEIVDLAGFFEANEWKTGSGLALWSLNADWEQNMQVRFTQLRPIAVRLDMTFAFLKRDSQTGSH
jgi:hypothetical protein